MSMIAFISSFLPEIFEKPVKPVCIGSTGTSYTSNSPIGLNTLSFRIT